MIVIRVFSDGWVGGILILRNDSVVFVMIVSVRLMVVIIKIGLVMLGRICCIMMIIVGILIIWVVWMYFFCFFIMVELCIVWVYCI